MKKNRGKGRALLMNQRCLQKKKSAVECSITVRELQMKTAAMLVRESQVYFCIAEWVKISPLLI